MPASYRLTKTLRLPYATAVARTKDALATEGFGVLSEIDVAATLKKKLDVTFRPYVILGACNPPLAHRALTEERDIGVLLPCNVVVYQGEEPDTSVVSAVDPEVSLSRVGNATLAPVAAEVKARIARVLERLSA